MLKKQLFDLIALPGLINVDFLKPYVKKRTELKEFRTGWNGEFM